MHLCGVEDGEKGRRGAVEFSECFGLSADSLSFRFFPSVCNYSLFITLDYGKRERGGGPPTVAGKNDWQDSEILSWPNNLLSTDTTFCTTLCARYNILFESQTTLSATK